MIKDKDIRIAIAAKIREALMLHYNITDPDDFYIRVHDRWILAFERGQSANAFKVTKADHEEFGLVHGWMIGLAGISRSRPDPVLGNQGAARLNKMNPNRRDVLRRYRIWCYHQLDTGEAGNESEVNSENRLADEIEAVSDYFSNHPKLGLEDIEVQGHTELQFGNIDTFKLGETQANGAQGTLEVMIQKPIRAVDT